MPVKRISVGGGVEAKLARMARGLKRGAVVRVGFLEGATYPDGTSVPMVAAINEFGRIVRSKDGDYYQLPRPFFRNMVREKSPEWPAGVQAALEDTDYDATVALTRVGEVVAGQLRESITTLTDPPLAPSTIRAKGGVTKPLVNTGHMLASVSYEVENDASTSQYGDTKMTGQFSLTSTTEK